MSSAAAASSSSDEDYAGYGEDEFEPPPLTAESAAAESTESAENAESAESAESAAAESPSRTRRGGNSEEEALEDLMQSFRVLPDHDGRAADGRDGRDGSGNGAPSLAEGTSGSSGGVPDANTNNSTSRAGGPVSARGGETEETEEEVEETEEAVESLPLDKAEPERPELPRHRQRVATASPQREPSSPLAVSPVRPLASPSNGHSSRSSSARRRRRRPRRPREDGEQQEYAHAMSQNTASVAIVMPTRRPESASGRSRSRHVRQHGRRQRASSTRAAAKLRPDDDTDGYIDDIDNGSDDYRQFQQQSRRPASASPRIISASASSSASSSSAAARQIHRRNQTRATSPVAKDSTADDEINSKSMTELAIEKRHRRSSPPSSSSSTLGSPYRAPVPGSERIAAAEAAAAKDRRRQRQKLRRQQLGAGDLRQESSQAEDEEDVVGQTTDEARAIREATLGAEQTLLKHLTREKYYRKQQLQQQQRSRKKRLAQLRSQERALLRASGYAEPDTSNPLISPQMAAPDLVSLRPSTVDYANYVPIRQQKDEAPAQGPLPARPRRIPRRPASAGGRMRGRRGGSRRNVAGRKFGGGRGNKLGKRRKMRQLKRAGAGLGLAAAASFPQWKVKLLVDAEIKRRKKSDNMRLRFERDFAMEELARARASMRRMKTRLHVAAKAAKRSAKRSAGGSDSAASSGDEEEGASANRNGDGEKSLEDVFRHATLAAAAKQFVSSTLTTLFNPVSSKKQSEGDSSELGDAQDVENSGEGAGISGDGGASPRNSRRSRRKRRQRRQNKKGRNLVACDDFIAVLSAAKESGAILPERGELQVISARLARRAGVNNAANGGGESCLDLEQWALCYPGDASEVLRWSCAMAGMHTAIF